MTEHMPRDLQSILRGVGHVLYHLAIVTISGAVALSLPFIAGFLEENFLAFWSRIKNEEFLLVSLEITVAFLLILAFNYIGRSISDRKISRAAAGAGLVQFVQAKGRLARKRIKKEKEKHGLARSVVVLGATGYRTFVAAEGDLHHVLRGCLEAKIMLLNPYSEAAQARARALLRPEVTTLRLREEIKQSIEFLKQLKAAHKNVKLKLYSDRPHMKLVILGDYIWMQHYHSNVDVETMPEYVFRYNRDNHSLYTLFYQYFVKRWESPEIPEYDLETDELVYRRAGGDAERREKFVIDLPHRVTMVGKGRAYEPDAPRY